MIIRCANKADVPNIRALLAHPAMRGAILPRSERAIATTLGNWIVGTDAHGSVVGCVSLEPRRPDLAEIRSLSVAPRARGQGFASTLLRTAIAQAWQRGFPSVFAQTRALSLFERAGFLHMTDDAEHRPLCGRELRAGYHRLRIDAPPLSLNVPQVTLGPVPSAARAKAAVCAAPVGRIAASPEGVPEPVSSDPNGPAPPGFHFHRYRKNGVLRPNLVA